MKQLDDDFSIVSFRERLENLNESPRFPCAQAVFNPRPVRSAVGEEFMPGKSGASGLEITI
jgi:hypothetical protein